MFLEAGPAGSPVLLFVHEGPGMPEHWLTRRHPTTLTRIFTVAWWEQRGAGLSYRPGIPAATMTVDQIIADTIEVARYLCRRFGVERVHLMGHSWGSFIGLQAAAQAPELFMSYIGMAQVTDQLASEQEAYREAVRDTAMHRLGVGTTRDMRSVITGIFLSSWASSDYTPREMVALWRGRRFSRSFGLSEQVLATDLTRHVTRLPIPVYFLHGRHDRTASYRLARTYARRVEAPAVGFYTFEHSAHSPAFEEPERTLQILSRDVLAGTTTLADPPDPP